MSAERCGSRLSAEEPNATAYADTNRHWWCELFRMALGAFGMVDHPRCWPGWVVPGSPPHPGERTAGMPPAHRRPGQTNSGRSEPEVSTTVSK